MEIDQRISSTNLKCQHKNTGTCDYNEPIDESSHPIPVFNSTASLISNTSMLKNNQNDTIMFQNQSQIALARAAVKDKRVELVPNMSAFIVQSINQKTYSS